MRVRGYPAGAPCWAEVASPDPATTRAFYGSLFGWNTTDDGQFTLDGRAVAGLRHPGSGPAAWLVSIATDDTEATSRAVTDAGGTVRLAPAEAGDLGTAMVVADTAGAVFATWQRGRFGGAQVTFEPGAICWYELATHDLARAGEFYGSVFGWELSAGESAPGEPYHEFQHHHDTVAGVVPIDGRFPSAAVPEHWTVCFMVEDCVSVSERIVELGGTVARKPMAVSAGWYSRVADPTGAHFAIIELSDEYRVD